MAASKHAPGTFCWFECGSKDPGKAKTFYIQLFGWTANDVPRPGDSNVYTLDHQVTKGHVEEGNAERLPAPANASP